MSVTPADAASAASCSSSGNSVLRAAGVVQPLAVAAEDNEIGDVPLRCQFEAGVGLPLDVVVVF